jgi:RecG-like helicase
VGKEENSDNVAVTALRGVGPRVAERLAALGIESLQDLLFHLPLRYQDRTRLSAIGSLRQGQEASSTTVPAVSVCVSSISVKVSKSAWPAASG